MMLRSVFYQSNDGLKLHGAYCGPEHGQPLILCLPGLARTYLDFVSLMKFLSEIGLRCLALDYRGRGLSDWDVKPENYSLEREFADLIGFLDAQNEKECIVIGTSRGGFHGMALSMLKPKLVRALVLNDVGPRIEMGGLMRIKSYVGKMKMPSSYAHGVEILKDFGKAHFTAFADVDWLNMAQTTWQQNEVGQLCLRYDPHLSKTLEAFDVSKPFPELWPIFESTKTKPVLVLRGENSDLLSQATVDEMCDRHPLCESYIVAGQGHAPALNDEPTQRQILNFIRKKL